MPFFSLGGGGGGDGGLPTLYGNGPPSNSIGSDGQLYIDKENGALYGPKVAGSWGSGLLFGAGNFADLVGVPSEFPPSPHGHAIADVVGLQAAIDAKQDSGDYATTAFVEATVSGLANTAPELLNTLAELANALGNDPNFAATITAQIAAKADSNHSHIISDVTGLQASLDAKQPVGSYSEIGHTHQIADVVGLQAAIDAKMDADASVGVAWSSPPDSETATGASGDIAYTAEFLYVCVSENLWKKSPLLAFDSGGGVGGSITILIQPSSGSAIGGSYLLETLGYLPSGATISYQWQQSSDGLAWSDIPTATTPTYSLSGLTTEDSGGFYRCRLSSAGLDDTFTVVAVVSVSGSGVAGVELLPPTVMADGFHETSFYKSADNIQLGATGWTVISTEYQWRGSETHLARWDYLGQVGTHIYAAFWPLTSYASESSLFFGSYHRVSPWQYGWLPAAALRARYRLERTVNGQPQQTTTDWSDWSVPRTAPNNYIFDQSPTVITTQPAGGTANLRLERDVSPFTLSVGTQGSVVRYRWASGSSPDAMAFEDGKFDATYSLPTPLMKSSVGTKNLFAIAASDFLAGTVSDPAQVIVPFSTLPQSKWSSRDDIDVLSAIHDYGSYNYRINLWLHILDAELRHNYQQQYDNVPRVYLSPSSKIEVITESSNSYGAGSVNWAVEHTEIYALGGYSPHDSIGEYLGTYYSGIYFTRRFSWRLREATVTQGNDTYENVWTVWSNWKYF